MVSISIAMATYNGARFIEAQLKSLAEQILLPTELIVADDGSDDETISILQNFAKTAPFKVIVHKNEARLGWKENFIRCSALCSGDLIAFSDQDDIWHADKLSTIAQRFYQKKLELAFHDFRLIDGAGRSIANDQFEFPVAPFGEWSIIRGFTIVIKRDLIRFNDLWRLSADPHDPTERAAHDQWFYFLGRAFDTLEHVEAPLVSYRLHGSNLYGGVKPAGVGIDQRLSKNRALIASALVGRGKDAATKRNVLYKTLLGRGLASGSRAIALRAIMQRENLVRDPLLTDALRTLDRTERVYMSRASIYEEERRRFRAQQFWNALTTRIYTKDVRGVKDAILDLFYGILLEPSEFVKRLREESVKLR